MNNLFCLVILILFIFCCQNNNKQIEYYPNGNLKREAFINNNGKEEGLVKYFYPSGKLMKTEEKNNGKADGWVKVYYESGNLKSSHYYINDTVNGPFEIYYDEMNSIKSVGMMQKGIGVDTFKTYYPNGVLESISFKKDGKFEGIAKTFHPNSKLKILGMYGKDHSLFYRADFDSLSNLIDVKGEGIMLTLNNDTLNTTQNLNITLNLAYLPKYDNWLQITIYKDQIVFYSKQIPIETDLVQTSRNIREPGEYFLVAKLFHSKRLKDQIDTDTSYIGTKFYVKEISM